MGGYVLHNHPSVQGEGKKSQCEIVLKLLKYQNSCIQVHVKIGISKLQLSLYAKFIFFLSI